MKAGGQAQDTQGQEAALILGVRGKCSVSDAQDGRLASYTTRAEAQELCLQNAKPPNRSLMDLFISTQNFHIKIQLSLAF